jgi:TfoX/Sxy family transcriptional regulator of competence genes
MASDQEFVEYLVDQMGGAGRIASRKMFGEFALYSRGKVVALVCDNQLFVKPTGEGRAFIGQPDEAPPYPGAKAYFLIVDRHDDREWIARLIEITAQALPDTASRKASRPKRR